MPNNNLIKIYQTEVSLNKIIANPEQIEILSELQKLANIIKNKNFWQKFSKYQHNIYLWGSVGIGKTYLLDLFYKNLITKQKHRWHILSLLHLIDHKLRQIKNQKNPMQLVMQELFHNCKIVCLDEFYVSDASQAELLNQCFEYWRQHRIHFVITSNTEPNKLFPNGAVQQKFQPTINIISRTAKIIGLQQKFDYRTAPKNFIKNYFFPHNFKNLSKLRHKLPCYIENWDKNGILSILGRSIRYIRKNNDTVWFDFSQICSTPRSQLDYIELCKKFDTFIISGLCALTPEETPKVILLMHLIDLLYDQNKNLLCISAVAIEKIYAVGPLFSAFQRTKSRIIELSSKDLPVNS